MPNYHALLVYENMQDQFDAVSPFIKSGADSDELCIYVFNENKQEDVLYELKNRGVNVGSMLQSQSLLLMPAEKVYLKSGNFDPRMMKSIFTDILSAQKKKYSSFRLTGEMTWALKETGNVDMLPAFENIANNFNQPLGLCQYNTKRFSPEIITNMILAHPQIVYKKVMYDNFFYIPPTEFLERDKSLTLKRMLQTLQAVTQEKLTLIEENTKKDNLINVASMNMKDPLTSLKIFEHLLQMHFYDLDDSKAWNLIFKIHKQVDKLATLISKFQTSK